MLLYVHLAARENIRLQLKSYVVESVIQSVHVRMVQSMVRQGRLQGMGIPRSAAGRVVRRQRTGVGSCIVMYVSPTLHN